MEGGFFAAYKSPGGKLIKVRVWLIEGGQNISRIRITGDFFLHPEESIEDLEACLVGASLEGGQIEERVAGFLQGDVELIGAGPEDFSAAIEKAINS